MQAVSIFAEASPSPSRQKHGNDLDMTALWLKNVYLLHDLLTQHSLKEVRCGNIHHISDYKLNLCCAGGPLLFRLWTRMTWFP